MNTDRINEVIGKLPINLIMALYLGYVGFNYYTFMSDPGSEINLKEVEATNARNTSEALKKKINDLNLFVKTLDGKKTEVRGLAQELESTKGSLPEKLDIPAIMKMILTEAKKVGLNVSTLKPVQTVNKEYYTEQPFSLVFQGVFPQLVVFLERLANVTEIVKIDHIEIKGTDANAEYVPLSGTIVIKLFKYLGTTADKVGSKVVK